MLFRSAISPNVHGELRIHACGRAEALRQFRNLLELYRSEALAQRAADIAG